jgi:type I restriction enzyme S subunit
MTQIKNQLPESVKSNNPCKSVIQTGYKQTEVGVIPEDWLEHSIGELIEFEGGSQPDKSYFRASWKRGYVRLIQIRDYKTDKYETYVPTHLARRFCTENDIMIGRYGPPVFQILRGIDGAYNVALIKAKPGSDIDGSYAYYFLKQEKLFSFIEKLSQRSSGQTGVDLKELRQYPLPLPPTKAEQEAIAEALSDTDALIESLDQLITKKRHLKQGAMQELLTGKKRLPGFSWEWEVKTFGDVFNITAGGDVDSTRTISYQDQTHCYPIYSNALTDSGLYGYCSYADHQAGTITVTARGTLGFANYRDHAYTAIGRVLVLHPKQESDGRFLAEAINNRVKFAIESTGVPQLTAPQISAYSLTIPLPQEQTAIATILTDMDAEITTLETKLAKTRQIKQGMMQNLLTGRIRLI